MESFLLGVISFFIFMMSLSFRGIEKSIRSIDFSIDKHNQILEENFKYKK